jgi:hypothetical protein
MTSHATPPLNRNSREPVRRPPALHAVALRCCSVVPVALLVKCGSPRTNIPSTNRRTVTRQSDAPQLSRVWRRAFGTGGGRARADAPFPGRPRYATTAVTQELAVSKTCVCWQSRPLIVVRPCSFSHAGCRPCLGWRSEYHPGTPGEAVSRAGSRTFAVQSVRELCGLIWEALCDTGNAGGSSCSCFCLR